MLKIKIGTTRIEASELEIPVTLRSPLFMNNGRMAGSYIFNFSVPLTDALKSEIDYLHRPASFNGPAVKRPFYLEQGPLKYVGECSVKAIKDGIVEISAPINTGSLAALLKDVKMSDVPLGGLRVETGLNRVDAKINVDMTYNEPGGAPFTREYDVYFADIILNTGSELSGDGKIFTSSFTGTHLMQYTLKSDLINEVVEFRIRINGAIAHTIPIESGTHHMIWSPDLVSGDVVSWTLYIESIYSFPFEGVIVGTFFKGNEVKISRQSLASYNGSSNLYPNSDYAVFPLENPSLLNGLPDDVYVLDHYSIKEIYSKHFPVINYYKNGNFPIAMDGVVNDEYFSAYNLFMPFPYLAYFIKKMADHLGITIEENAFTAADLKQLTIYNAFAENEYISSNIIKIIDGFDLKNHVPDEKLSDFINEVCKLLGIAVDYNSFTKSIRFRNIDTIVNNRSYKTFPGVITSDMELEVKTYNGYRLFQETTGDEWARNNFKSLDGLNYKGMLGVWTQLTAITNMEINDCWFVVERGEYYYWNYNEETAVLDWVFYSKDFFHEFKQIDENIDGDTFELKTKWAACMMNYNDWLDHQLGAPLYRKWLIPRTDNAGGFESMPPQFTEDFSRYLIFYRGMRNDSVGNPYPLASADVYDYFWSKIPGADLALRWDGDYGLWEKKHKAFVTWMINQPGKFTVKAYLTPLQLSKLDFFVWQRILGHDFLISEIRFNITVDDVSIAEMDIYRR